MELCIIFATIFINFDFSFILLWSYVKQEIVEIALYLLMHALYPNGRSLLEKVPWAGDYSVCLDVC